LTGEFCLRAWGNQTNAYRLLEVRFHAATIIFEYVCPHPYFLKLILRHSRINFIIENLKNDYFVWHELTPRFLGTIAVCSS